MNKEKVEILSRLLRSYPSFRGDAVELAETYSEDAVIRKASAAVLRAASKKCLAEVGPWAPDLLTILKYVQGAMPSKYEDRDIWRWYVQLVQGGSCPFQVSVEYAVAELSALPGGVARAGTELFASTVRKYMAREARKSKS